MARWQPDARSRLAQAALDLFGEHGYDRTTVAEIAERAGLAKRTFFRHFADKREVLFSGTDELEQLIVAGIGAAPTDAAPLDAVMVGLEATTAMFEERRSFATERQGIIAAHPELRERELIKLERLTAAVAAALHDRGVADPGALLTAQAGGTIFRVAFARWATRDERRSLGSLLHATRQDLRDAVRDG
jgi:AcrR family transcriptional regulator